MRTTALWTIGILLAAAAVNALAAGRIQLQAVRQHVTSGQTQVVFDLNQPFKYEWFTLKQPRRVVIDFRNTVRGSQIPGKLAGKGVVGRIRTGIHKKGLRVVLDLDAKATPHVSVLGPQGQRGNRLVIDLPDKAAGKQPPTPVVSASSHHAGTFVVAVDAGHGGRDDGATGPDGIHEKTVTLAIARRLAKRIDAQPGMHAVLTRAADHYVGLRQRILKARKAEADLFVSIHADAFRSAGVQGASVYALSLRGATSEHARFLARRENAVDLIGGLTLKNKDKTLASFMLDLSQSACIDAGLDFGARVLRHLSAVTPLHKSKVQQAAFVVLKSPDIPSILVETGFITNPHEERLLNSPAYQNGLAKAIVSGIKGYVASYRPSPSGATLATYTVRPGDTLSGIAARLQVSTTRLEKSNGLADGDTIHSGQKLVIPDATRVASSAF